MNFYYIPIRVAALAQSDTAVGNKAMLYATIFLYSEIPIDNTDTERLIRDMVMGKKSCLFCRDLDACKRATMMYSLFGACKVLNKNPERWLCHVLKNIKTTPKDKLYTLLPEFWEDDEQ